ncbi:1,5-anhydro-D-fructose reductase [Pleurostoma richardsiae]|uniref:1,5-anhydro-D-fructose reductase n=1 Tax=Pleurostoma richardsiae TaxID=41990 RepID=A0AA38W0X3_9PEZI|nr:1,5-anhydro-D-fructose reductase [Pleurostoma richardsiae]
MSASPPRMLIIGAGSRGQTYARATVTSTNGVVAAVAEPHPYKREQLGRSYIWGTAAPPPEGAQFASWTDFIAYETRRRERVAAGEPNVPPGVDAAYVCVQDEMHREVVVALARLGGLHIMSEKPLATRLEDCVEMYRALRANRNERGEQMVFSIGHVLRYSPHNITLRKLLLEDRVVGDILSVVHTEPIGWWHFTHSYVRGNWRREDTSAPSLLTKSCHDIDVLLWLLCSPVSYKTGGESAVPHLPSTVSSTGSLQFFKKSRKPVGAGAATNCLSCPVEDKCKYSAKRVYVGDKLRGLATGNTSWPIDIVVPDIEDYKAGPARQETLLAKLAEDYDKAKTPNEEVRRKNWFGRCVFESDNDVADEQVVTLTWDEDPLPEQQRQHDANNPVADALGGRGAKQATFHMVAHTTKQCDRFTHVYGVDGEVYADSFTITVEDFRTGAVTTHRPKIESLGHGGGDNGLARQFVLAVDKVKNHGWETVRAQRELVGCTLEEVIRSHGVVFAAEEARREGRRVDWREWWEREVEGKLDG